jgi:glycosyltransferase involved in cell wall biosynthesis
MTATILVVTTVHDPDDTRIRERLIRCLSSDFDVLYATRSPGPTDTEGLRLIPLAGGRLARNLRALGVLLRRDWDVAVVHDPELVPWAVVARLVRRHPVVFDVHEDLVAQVAAKDWIPGWAKSIARAVGRAVYWLAGKMLVLTLAEAGYSRLFGGAHVVFPNYPHLTFPAELAESGDGSAVYVGDVKEARGLGEAVVATSRAGVRFEIVGRASSEYIDELGALAIQHGGELEFLGPLPNPDALRIVAAASVGLSPLRDLPNYTHSLPTKVIEYLAMGVPVVASDLPGTREHIAALEAVELTPPGDIDAMARAIRTSVSPGVKEVALEQAAAIRRRFSWPAEEVRQFYRGLAGEETESPADVHDDQG